MGSRIRVTGGVLQLGPHAVLTSHERLILNALWSGKTTNQTAAQLGLSVTSVKGLRHRLRRKYQASNVAQLVRAALAHGDLNVA